MLVLFILLFAIATVCCSSPLGEYENAMQKEGIDINRLRHELRRESAEVEKEFEDEETQRELSKLRASYPSSTNGTIQEKSELDINGDMSKYLFQGDIVLTREQWARAIDLDPHARLQRRQALTAVVSRWTPMGAPVIPYSYAPGFPENQKSVITQSLAFWEQRTCIKFRPAATADRNVIEFNHNSNGCSSFIGMIGRKQQVNLAPGCFSVTVVTHELSHALGTMHVQTRSDRDAFVIVDTANIQRGLEHNFARDPPNSGKTSNFGIPYEFGSAMHYPENAFAINPSRPTIFARPAFARFQKSMEGPRPTFYDTLLINRMYTCTAKCTNRIACQNNGVQDGSNCARCFCPKGWVGTNCEKRPDNATIMKLTGNQRISLNLLSNNNEYKEQTVVIEAPVGMRIQAVVLQIGELWFFSCRTIGMEIVPTKDTRSNGFRFCSRPEQTPIVSDSNEMLVFMYNESGRNFRTEIAFTII